MLCTLYLSSSNVVYMSSMSDSAHHGFLPAHTVTCLTTQDQRENSDGGCNEVSKTVGNLAAVFSASDDSNLVLLLLQPQLKLVIEVKRLVPATKQLVPKDLCELLLQSFYVLQGKSLHPVASSCMFCLTDCSRYHYFRLHC